MSEELPPETPAMEVEPAPTAPRTVHFGEKHLRRRPFLVITTMASPRQGVSTHVKGWGDNESNWNMAESAKIVDSVSNRMLAEATFVIDIINNKVVKNRHAYGDETVLSHFLAKYSDDITRGIERWASQNTPIPKVTITNEEAPE